MYKLGIDVGGTNTDAVLIDENLNVVAAVKNPTSDDIYTGIMGAVDAVLDASGIDRALIGQAMLGTTQCTNAIVERKGLAPIAVLRIGAPATVGIPPMVDWADDIAAVCVDSRIIEGGFEYDGKRLAEFDEAGCRAFFEGVRGRVEAVAISCVFSTVRADDEVRAAEIAREVLGEGVHVSISSEIGSMGLIERENATILNAALYDVARKFTEGFAASLADKGVTNAEVYLSQNDGTLMTMEHARRYPILTIACGPTNSIRGASYLSRRDDAIVIDVGGTTTDLGVLAHGFPRESGVAVTIGGVRTNFRMPDVVSIGLGGGSIVRVAEDGSGAVTVGPDSVGYAITERALVFGGDTMTATDVAVRLGMAEVGDASLVADIPQEVAEGAMAAIRTLVEDAIDVMKVSSDPIDVVLVGGGAIVLPQDLAGTASVDKPEHAGCANAIGSAISKVSGVYEALVDYDVTPRDEALAAARAAAIEAAVEAGAIRETVEIIDAEDVPLAYYPGHTNRVKVKASGDLG
ncbi:MULTISPECIES: hydantoinase/oxoprolinase family protein [Gordonibacter]|uniref:Hydantoinase/oxoprolinase family protein n=1 Tax=Gordonibacter faecis TaxID=3047475 RepID=A0ABT7DME6_9ACTN|nr:MULTISPECIES: hydantoinase/oxoprolinase family protein [unclassified Gordonibacter]MDJ1649743.1 hydantoinase/oxoprolinase family protein [Gordonibacter sp. KGMB12511]HIW76546.1 hydantoinase/oxoprolinase family protein [Candidatus Gordonibacter avicola]